MKFGNKGQLAGIPIVAIIGIVMLLVGAMSLADVGPFTVGMYGKNDIHPGVLVEVQETIPIGEKTVITVTVTAPELTDQEEEILGIESGQRLGGVYVYAAMYLNYKQGVEDPDVYPELAQKWNVYSSRRWRRAKLATWCEEINHPINSDYVEKTWPTWFAEEYVRVPASSMTKEEGKMRGATWYTVTFESRDIGKTFTLLVTVPDQKPSQWSYLAYDIANNERYTLDFEVTGLGVVVGPGPTIEGGGDTVHTIVEDGTVKSINLDYAEIHSEFTAWSVTTFVIPEDVAYILIVLGGVLAVVGIVKWR